MAFVHIFDIRVGCIFSILGINMKYILWMVASVLLGLFLFPVIYSVSLVYFQGGILLLLVPFFIFVLVVIFVYGIIWLFSNIYNNADDGSRKEKE